MNRLEDQVKEGGLFQGYAYGYPHKMAYRHLDPAESLEEIWRDENKDALFLYAHVPFCKVRCGFCNLFTSTGRGAETNRVGKYLDALERQAVVVREALGPQARIARIALGGGTPTFLEVAELERLFRILSRFDRTGDNIPIAVEMSPDTIDPNKLGWLRDQGATRASIGVQSFVEAETRALGRPQNAGQRDAALTAMREADFPVRNLDLIYGIEGQDWVSWRTSLEAAHRYEPEELFLYPLYVRPHTGLGRRDKRPADGREDLYRRGRDWLLERGYEQISMRMFRSMKYKGDSDPHYCCQEDGMVGLGAGARSYTQALHYSTEWAVGRTGVLEILDHYIHLPESNHAQISHGARLNEGEQKRRYVIKSVLKNTGLDLIAYGERFGTAALMDFPELQDLVATKAATLEENLLRPTSLGLEWSDVIGPWLYSEATKCAIAAFDLR